MQKRSALVLAITCFTGFASIVPATSRAQLSSNVQTYASGLNGPRGLKFDPDGQLYVAEAGTGGTTSTKGQCAQVIPPIGPYTGGMTSRISKITREGKRETVASGFPSSVDSNTPSDISGVGDLAFLDGRLYAVLSGAGCSHGSSVPNAIVRVDNETGKWKVIADLSSFLKAHQAKYENAADFEPDGIFYSLVAHRDRLYTVEPNHGQVFSITPEGKIREEIDISEAEGHIVPTAIAERNGDFFVGNLGLFPITPNSSKILTLTRNWFHDPAPGLDPSPELQKLKVAGSRAGFTTIVGVDFGPDGLLYVLEFSPEAGYPTPGTGKVVRLKRDGEIEEVATGLTVPTAMTFGPDGHLYVSNLGAAAPGAGEIVRISIY
ncbi:glucose/arabinose dehydrogenase [Granulicella aggregans]|uniref:Glucose/arabinose dehydrogenase n=1 Tax=Granulicella aggregans TaxID=474949 RepID=A0A7W7ZDR5_9BACT|nr:ScyD/ScyE family protein [Granulicella aggregans]MBB5058045.1 glucose/arabinose dehydrogenase [Granulicella aggregans]